VERWGFSVSGFWLAGEERKRGGERNVRKEDGGCRDAVVLRR
jgi:hypothetical protein